MNEQMDTCFTGSPLTDVVVENRRQSTGSLTTQTDNGVDATSCPRSALQMVATSLTTLTNLINASTTYVDTISDRSDVAIAALKQDLVTLAESILRVEARLDTLESDNTKKNTADITMAAASKDDDNVDTFSDSVDILEQRLGSLESRVRNLEQLLMKNMKRCNYKEIVAKSA